MFRRLLAVLVGVVAAAQAFGQFKVTTIAGSTGGGGWQDGALRDARFESPRNVAADRFGNLYVTDDGNLTVRRIGRDGQVTTIAGAPGVSGTADGPGPLARFALLNGIALDASGNVYVSDAGSETIRRIGTDGMVSTIAGLAGARGGDDGKGSTARFSGPAGLACDAAGNVFVADGSAIRKITPDGTVRTINSGDGGYFDGPVVDAKFDQPADLAVDGSGNLFVADTYNDVVRKITSDGMVSTVAGAYKALGYDDGLGTAARFYVLTSLDVDAAGNVYMIDFHSVRRIAPDGTVTTIAGSPSSDDYRDGVGSEASFVRAQGLTVDPVSGAVFIADAGVGAIRRVEPATGAVTTYAGSVPSPGSANGPSLEARFNLPRAAVSDSLGNLFVLDAHSIRKITPAGVVSTFAGDPEHPGAVDGTAGTARFSYPRGLAVDASDNLYVADLGNYTVRKVTSAAVVTTVAGSAGVRGFADGAGSAVRFGDLANLTVDANGNLYISDEGNDAIRKMDTAGVVSTLVGKNPPGQALSPTANSVVLPLDMAFDATGSLYIADYALGAILKFASGQVTTVTTGLDSPSSIAVAPDGRVYVSMHGTIARVGADGTVTTVAGQDTHLGNVDGIGAESRLGDGTTIRFDRSGRLLIADTANHAIRTGTFVKPVARNFTASPSDVKHAGDAATLTWNTTALNVTIDGVARVFPPSGSLVVNPTATTTYHLTATGDGGTANAIVTVYVGNPPPRRAVAH